MVADKDSVYPDSAFSDSQGMPEPLRPVTSVFQNIDWKPAREQSEPRALRACTGSARIIDLTDEDSPVVSGILSGKVLPTAQDIQGGAIATLDASMDDLILIPSIASGKSSSLNLKVLKERPLRGNNRLVVHIDDFAFHVSTEVEETNMKNPETVTNGTQSGRTSGAYENTANGPRGAKAADPYVGQCSPAVNRARDGYREVVEHIKSLGYTSEEDLANFEGTEDRMARALGEFILPKRAIEDGLTKILSKCFPMTGNTGIVIQDCVTIGMCPHHLLPVIHQMYVGYLPKDTGAILGMSKLIRIAELLSKRAILQEKLAIDITATLYNGCYDDAGENPTGFPHIETAGAICVMGSLHSCMATRGVRSFSLAREVSLRGAFLHDKALKEEAFRIINQFPSTQFPLK